MIIGIDITELSITSTGIQTYIINILDNLQKFDHANHYVLLGPRASAYPIVNAKWRKAGLLRFNFPGSRTFWMHVLLPVLLKKYKIDALWSPVFLAPACIRRKVSSVVMIHDLTYLRYPETMGRIRLLIHRILVKRSVKRANAVIVNSAFTKRELHEAIPVSEQRPVIVAPCGKPSWPVPANYAARERSDFLFFAGNFEPRKNIMTLFKALEMLHSQGLKIQLQIAGPPGWKNRGVHDYLSRSTIRDQIRFLGYLDQSELIGKYCSCKALVYPSLYEGFGIPVLEALSLDCLVLTSAGTVMEEICGPAALYFDPADAANMAAAIAAIYQEDFDRKKYLDERSGVLERYDWENSAKIILGALTGMETRTRMDSANL